MRKRSPAYADINKKFFRHFRGELNGFFLNAICTFLNKTQGMTDIIHELQYQNTSQWRIPLPDGGFERSIRNSDAVNLCQIGGLFQPRFVSDSSIGSLWFAPLKKDRSGGIISERGLVDTEKESFVFDESRTVEGYKADDPPDRSLESRKENRGEDGNVIQSGLKSSYVGVKGLKPYGWVRNDVDHDDRKTLFDAQGNLREENIVNHGSYDPPDPPPGEPWATYEPYYGEEYLTIVNKVFVNETPLNIDVYLLLFESMQRIRRMGSNIATMLEITEILCVNEDGGMYVNNLRFYQNEWYQYCFYSRDDTVEMEHRERRYQAWLLAMRMKFPMFAFHDRNVGEKEEPETDKENDWWYAGNPPPPEGV